MTKCFKINPTDPDPCVDVFSNKDLKIYTGFPNIVVYDSNTYWMLDSDRTQRFLVAMTSMVEMQDRCDSLHPTEGEGEDFSERGEVIMPGSAMR